MASIDGYDVLRQLYDSSNSKVFRAVRQDDGLPVVIKILQSEYPPPSRVIRFRQEHSITDSLSHLPGVINVVALEKHENTLRIVFEDFGGESLDRIMYERKLGVDEIIDLAIQITGVLGDIHGEAIIHKDIEPSNIVYNYSTGQLKIIDFGIATHLTKQRQVFQQPDRIDGTVLYMSPEQTGRMNRSIDYRSDYYSFGATLYKLLTGTTPFEGSDSIEVVHGHLALQPKPPRSLNPEIPESLSQIVMKLLSKNAEDRYLGSAGLLSDLRKCKSVREQGTDSSAFELGSNDIPEFFEVPQRLYGRDSQVAYLLNQFEMVREGDKRILLVSGHPGIGKTSLVNEIYKPVTESNGYYISGKFDQYKRNTPYSAIRVALGQLIRQILCENEESLAKWKMDILDAVGSSGNIIIDIIPELEIVLGSQPKAPDLGPLESQNRFNMTFLNFLNVFCKSDHPMTIFLDDLQWADSSTLRLLELILLDRRIQYLYIIGAYRDTEVTAKHPLFSVIGTLKGEHVEINDLHLDPLKLKDVETLLSDALYDSGTQISLLAELIGDKTGGNPFFINEFLQSLYIENCLNFDTKIGRWSWDLNQISNRRITDNVVELIAQKIQELGNTTRELIKLSSCLGSSFDVETLRIITDDNAALLQDCLSEAVNGGVLIAYSLDNSNLSEHEAETLEQYAFSYTFSHDRVQQAAYSLIDENLRPEIHWNIGNRMYAATSLEDRESRIIEIVNQLNQGVKTVQDPNTRLWLADLNLASGRKARKEAAFEHAFDYCSYGMDLLSESCWETNYELSLDLHTEAAQAAYLSGRIEDMESIASLVLDKAKTLLDRTKAHEVMIQGYFATARFTEAVEEGVKVLGDFGVHFPKKHQNIYLLWEFIKTKLALIGKAPESLVDLPEVKNDSELAIRRVTGSIWLPIYCGKPELIPYVALKMVRWSAKNGNSDESPYSYAAYALIVNAIQGDIESSYRFGQIARMTIEKVDTRQAAPRTLFVVNYMIRHWKEHPKLMIEPFKEIYRMGLDVGDYEFASLSGYASVLFPFFSGGELNSLQKEMGRMNDAMLVMKQNSLLQHGLLVRQVMLNLEGPPDGVTEINGEVYSEDGSIPKYQETNEIIGLFHVYFYKMILCYMFEKYPDAEIFALETEKYLECVVGIIHGPIFNFYDSLIRLATINSASTFKRRRFWSRIKSNQKQMKRWMEHSQTNFSHKYYLVEAERHRFLGNHLKATHFYDLATRLAQKNDFLNEEALANELAAKYYLAREMKTCARAYLEQARYCYFRWGANAKVEQIERRYGDLIGQAPSASTHDTKENRQKKSLTDTTSTGIRENLDLEAIIKASQAISTEISITSLMGQLLKITIESSGAQRGFLILETGRELNIEATAEITNEGLINIEIGRKPEFQGISKSVVDYVARTRLKVALDDASQKGLFINDPYILKHKPISILCVPIIYQGKLIGVIYLENNITIGAFTEDRLIVMDLLLTQAAISLEIAHLFDNLEQQVELRTEQLSEAKEKADTANKAKSVFLASMSHELRTPLNSILGFSQVLKRDNSLSMENKQAIEVIEHSGEHLLNLINDVLDLAKIEARKMELSESVFYLPSIVSSVFDIFHIPAKKKGLSLSLMTINRPQDESQRDASDIENVLPPIWLRGDERRLRQILINIVGNALKFTDKGGVTVEVGRVRQLEPPKIEPMTDEDCSNTKIRFRISDTGIGIEKEKIEKLFEPFYQGATPSTQDQGTGLGLAICQNFLHLMGSKLNVESIPGEGTIFWFDIDFLESSAHSVGASHKIHDIISFSGKKLRILIVDDNSENRQLFVRILRDIGFDTIESSGGKEALNIALEVNPDIVIIDLFMPDMSGFELIQLIRKNDQIKCVGIIATSASVNDEERLNSLASGANSFLPKPFNPRELLDEIKNISDIEFVYNPADADIEKNIVLTQDVTINADLIEKMSRLASMGDVTTLRSQIMDLEKSDERLKPLTEKLDQLATKFQMRQLQKVLKQIKPHQ